MCRIGVQSTKGSLLPIVSRKDRYNQAAVQMFDEESVGMLAIFCGLSRLEVIS